MPYSALAGANDNTLVGSCKYKYFCPLTCYIKKLNDGVFNYWVMDELRKLFKNLKDSLLATF